MICLLPPSAPTPRRQGGRSGRRAARTFVPGARTGVRPSTSPTRVRCGGTRRRDVQPPPSGREEGSMPDRAGTMTPSTDSLEAALLAVPLRCTVCRFRAPDGAFAHEHTSFERCPDELVAAARKWMQTIMHSPSPKHMPIVFNKDDKWYEARVKAGGNTSV